MKASNVKVKIIEGSTAANAEAAYETWRTGLKDQVFIGTSVALIADTFVIFVFYAD